MRNVKIDSTDSELDQRVAGMQPYTTVSVTIATARPSVQQEDGSTEHAPDDVQNLSALVPGRELQQNMALYAERVEEFKEQFPDFEKYVGQDLAIPLSVRDEILRQPNGPDIALFLGFAPDVIQELLKMDLFNAARCIESISEDLERAVARDDMDDPTWKAARNQAAAKKQNLVKKAPRVRKR